MTSSATLPALAVSMFLFVACSSRPDEPPRTSHADVPAREQAAAATDEDSKPDVYSLTATSLDGTPVDLGDYRGKVTLFVNVASECGFTPQYAGLQELHAELRDRGFAVLGFPSNEFGGQEPGSAEQIREFCDSRFGVEFPMFAKIVTRSGEGQSPVYATLVDATGKQPGWNFCKYLVGKDGEVLGFYPSNVAPDAPELRTAIAAALE